MFMSVLYSWPIFLWELSPVAGSCHGWLRRCASPGGAEGAATEARQPAAARSASCAERAAARRLRAIGHGLALPRSGGSRKADAR